MCVYILRRYDLFASSDARSRWPSLILFSLGLMTRVVLATLLAVTAIAAEPTPSPIPDGMPFGRIEDADLDRLQDFAVKHGFDLNGGAGPYGSNGADGDALGRVFVFFTTVQHT